VQLAIGIIASLIGGGLAGASVSVISNRIFHWRELRTKFYPVLNNMFAAYAIRMQNPNGRYWTIIVGYMPSPEDKDFVEHRSSFIAELVQYNELKEVRILRKQLLDNMSKGNHTHGEELKLDLLPESKALGVCFTKLHKKLKMLA
jgi:hypothetical protein